MHVYGPQYRYDTYTLEINAQSLAENPSGSNVNPYNEYNSVEYDDTQFHSRSNPFNQENFLSGIGMYAGQMTRLLTPSIASMVLQEQDREKPVLPEEQTWQTDTKINNNTQK